MLPFAVSAQPAPRLNIPSGGLFEIRNRSCCRWKFRLLSACLQEIGGKRREPYYPQPLKLPGNKSLPEKPIRLPLLLPYLNYLSPHSTDSCTLLIRKCNLN